MEFSRNNPASRLHKLFRAANGFSNAGNARQVWAKTFGIEQLLNQIAPADLVDLLTRLLAIAQEVQAVRQFAIDADKPKALWHMQLEMLERALVLNNLEVAYSTVAPTGEALLSLAWFANEMPDEGELAELAEQRMAMIVQLGDFAQSLRESRLPERVKLEVLELLERIERALQNATITGPIPLYRTVREVERSLEDLAPVLADDPEALSGIHAWLQRMKPSARYFAAIAKTSADVAKVLESGAKLLLGPGDSPLQ